MASSRSLVEQFERLVERAGSNARAHLCDGDSSTALVWDEGTEISLRLSLRAEEIWLLAGSGVLVRFVVPSDGEFDLESISRAIDAVLRGGAVEYFGLIGSPSDEYDFATGFEVEGVGMAAGLNSTQAAFRARLAGPLAQAALTIPGAP